MAIHTSKVLKQSKKIFKGRYVKNKTRQTARVIKIRNNSHQELVPSPQGKRKLRRRKYFIKLLIYWKEERHHACK